MGRCSLLFTMLWLLAPQPGLAQGAPSSGGPAAGEPTSRAPSSELGAGSQASALVPGARIRIHPGARTGVVVFPPDDTLVALFSGTDTLAIPLSALERLEVSRGRQPATATGVVIGLFVGGAAAATLAALQEKDDREFFGPLGAGVVGFAMGSLPGALLGGLVGRQIRVERWEAVAFQRGGS